MKSCQACGSTESQALADASSLGLVEEFTSGAYTCCQIAAWADEQLLAWFEAMHDDAKETHEARGPVERSEDEPALVPVRLRRQMSGFGRA